ncbi:hypothetical protein [Nostoc sp.]|uniref:hypothetical protein n=1 Tax=Nostoc sp. TaxID=1180 RepID=UPI002FFA1096
MKRTLYIPDELWTQLDQYLKDHPEQNPSSVVQAALAEKLRPKNGSRLLSLAGIVENAPTDASVNEDYLMAAEAKEQSQALESTDASVNEDYLRQG